MPFFESMGEDAGPPDVFSAYPAIYRAWSEMSECLMNGDSPLAPGERELILAFAAGVAGCEYVYVAHRAVAKAHGIEEGLIETLVESLDTAPASEPMKALLRFVRKLALTPGAMAQDDADAVFAAGWGERALHDAIAITARAAFMQRLVEGHGFVPMSRELAAERAQRRLERGYVKLYPAFDEGAP